MNDWPEYEEDDINHGSFVFYESFFLSMESLKFDEKAMF